MTEDNTHISAWPEDEYPLMHTWMKKLRDGHAHKELHRLIESAQLEQIEQMIAVEFDMILDEGDLIHLRCIIKIILITQANLDNILSMCRFAFPRDSTFEGVLHITAAEVNMMVQAADDAARRIN
jgi:hypothetical protein